MYYRRPSFWEILRPKLVSFWEILRPKLVGLESQRYQPRILAHLGGSQSPKESAVLLPRFFHHALLVFTDASSEPSMSMLPLFLVSEKEGKLFITCAGAVALRV